MGPEKDIACGKCVSEGLTHELKNTEKVFFYLSLSVSGVNPINEIYSPKD